MEINEINKKSFIKKLYKWRVKYASTYENICVKEKRKILRDKDDDPIQFAERVLSDDKIASPRKTLAVMSNNEMSEYLASLSHHETAELLLYILGKLKIEGNG